MSTYRRVREFIHHWRLMNQWRLNGDYILLAGLYESQSPAGVSGAPRPGERTWLMHDGREINSRDIAILGDIPSMTGIGNFPKGKRDIRRWHSPLLDLPMPQASYFGVQYPSFDTPYERTAEGKRREADRILVDCGASAHPRQARHRCHIGVTPSARFAVSI